MPEPAFIALIGTICDTILRLGHVGEVTEEDGVPLDELPHSIHREFRKVGSLHLSDHLAV